MRTECEICGEDVLRFKHLKKVGNKRICKTCAVNIRNNKRKELIEKSPKLKEDLRVLKNKEARQRRIEKVGIERKPGRPRTNIEDFPRIKGSKESLKKPKSNCYITLQEKQNYLRILMSRGIEFEEAKERIKELIESQKILRKEMKSKGKSEEQIKIKQKEMLEELWNN